MHHGEAASFIALWVLICRLGKGTCQLCLKESSELKLICTQLI